ncbi:MAG: acyl phosphate:glycerol-3-phosphate acyltransferase [Gaiellaceae bacterium]|nr:acyl phosphate:glycerol-3-phosphate acyltransferase [Gaiellaceae bacterium]
MTPAIPTAIATIAGYLAGSMPFGYWVVRVFKLEDIRQRGSGGIGATNVWRAYGRWYGVPVVLLDVLKGFVPALLAVIFVSHVAGVLAGAAAMLGHWRPVFLRFEKGGKMVATCGGAFFGLAPYAALGAGLLWILVFVLTRYASVASLVAALSLPVLVYLTGKPWSVVGFAAAAALAVVVLHRANLSRLRAGTENRFELKRRRRKAPAPAPPTPT